MDSTNRLLELAARAVKSGRTVYTPFLEPSMQSICHKCARETGGYVAFFGGYPEAERVIAAFTELPPEEEVTADFPIVCLDITWNPKFADAGHRDLLGAVMGLNIERDTTGDIVLAGNGKAYLFILPEMADYVSANFRSAGRVSVQVSPHTGEIVCPPPEGVHCRVTMASLRMDAMVSAGYDLSRAEAQRLIRAGLVKRNHVVEERADCETCEGDLLSVKGYGRMKIEELTGQTRRGRLSARIFRYGGSK